MQLTLQKAARINTEMDRVFQEGKSEYLSHTTVHTNHEICQSLESINSEFKLFEKSRLTVQNYIESLRIDGEEVIGLRESEIKPYYYNYTNYKEFFVDTEKICQLAVPAPFGKGHETVYDEKVRKALEVSANRIEIIDKKNGPDFDTYFGGLAPQNKKFVYKLYKMQIYQEGGKFERHKDTIHAPNHYATLVVNVSKIFTGGELVLYKNSYEKNERNELETETEKNENILHTCKFTDWNEGSILFLTDIDHEVKPVKSGIRIVLQYDVYIEDIENKSEIKKTVEEDEEDEGDNTECPYNKDLKTYLCNEKYIDEINTDISDKLLSQIEKFLIGEREEEGELVTEFSFLLSRHYPLTVTAEFLKLGDRKLYEILKSKYNVELGYVINKFESDYYGSYDQSDRKCLEVMSYSDIQRFLTDFSELEDKLEKLEDKSKKVVPLFVSSGNFHNVKYQHYIEFTGNEAAPAEYSYVSIVLSCSIRD